MLTRPPLILDTDVISCFAWVKRMDILAKLYSGKMVVPAEVVYEISNRRVQHLQAELKCSEIRFAKILKGSLRTVR